jgi:hypothetical protein
MKYNYILFVIHNCRDTNIGKLSPKFDMVLSEDSNLWRKELLELILDFLNKRIQLKLSNLVDFQISRYAPPPPPLVLPLQPNN